MLDKGETIDCKSKRNEIHENNVSVNSKHETQLFLVKKQVKAIMEEVVMKKFIHEESPCVLQLCATLEQCLQDSLKRRTTGFLRSNKIANIYTKVAKVIPAVGELVKQIEEAEIKLERSNDEIKLDQLSLSTNIFTAVNGQKNNGKHLWVRMALTNKLLDKIMEYLVQNSSKFYQESAIMADPVMGLLLATLIVGPCSLDYTKLKTQDHYWTDPPADELLQRHKLHSRAKPKQRGKRPTLNFAPPHATSSSSDSLDCNSCFREYVESLHQNSKISLLYGKNNVTIRPEEFGPVPGYLSLHQDGTKVMIKWTPNELMHEGKTGSFEYSEKYQNGDANFDSRSISFLKFVISVDIRDIVYLHCHHQVDNGGTLVLVGQDGVQWPPILFPPGGHLLSFLSCLENGLRPFGFLDPPLWSEKGKGKVFPRLRRRSHRRSESPPEADDLTDFVFRVGFTSDSSNVTSSDVKKRFSSNGPLLQPVTSLPTLWNKSVSASSKKPTHTVKSEPERIPPSISRSVVIKRDLNSSSPISVVRSPVQPNFDGQKNGVNSQNVLNSTGVFESTDEYVPNLDMYTWDQNQPRHYNEPDQHQSERTDSHRQGSLKILCDSMRRQILFRAFSGWFAHCRHLSGVRTYLTALVNPTIVPSDRPTDASVGVTPEVWDQLAPHGVLRDMKELSRYVYFGGVKALHLRPLIWMYLLGHYPPGSTREDRVRIDEETISRYEEIRAVDEDIKRKCNENAEASVSTLLSSSADKSSWTSDYVPAPMVSQTSSNSDVFTPDPESTAKIDKFEVPNQDLRRGSRKGRSLREKRKQLLKRTKSEESYVPYSSISTTTSFDLTTSFSMKSFSFDEDYDVLKTVHEESERSSITDLRAEASIDKDATPDKVINRSTRRRTDSSSLKSETIDTFSLNLTQIEKDVHRCDRNHNYFSQEVNLQKLTNIMSCFVWEHPEIGYVQGMCDLVAPLLVLIDDECVVYSCFVKLMQRITFQKGNEMDDRLDNLRSLIQVLDSELFEHLLSKNDHAPFFFCYRWFLLEFKRELSYDEDVFAVWECSWAAKDCSTPDLGLFFALAMLENYREVILENDMDFPAIVKFFNEMAERHDATQLLKLTRKLTNDVQCMIHR